MSLRKDDIVILILNILIYLNKNPVIPVKPDITFTRATPSDIFMKSHSMAQLNKILLIPGRLSGNIRPVLFLDGQDCFNHGYRCPYGSEIHQFMSVFPIFAFLLRSQPHLPRCCVGGPVSLHFLFSLYKLYLNLLNKQTNKTYILGPICHYQPDISILSLFLGQAVLFFLHSLPLSFSLSHQPEFDLGQNIALPLQ